MSKVHDPEDPERQGAPEAEAVAQECALCKAGYPLRIQATNWSDKVGKPCHILGTGWMDFEWCKKGGYP